MTLAWLVLAGCILVIWLFTIPAHLQAAGEDWVISRAVNQLASVIPSQVFLIYVFAWQILGASLFLLAALAIFKEIILPGKPDRHLAFWVSLVFLLLPLLLYMNAAGIDSFRPGLWGKIQSILMEAAWLLAIVGYLGLFFLLPFGIEPPRGARWLALAYGLGLLAILVLLVSEVAGDLAWGLLMIMIVGGLLIGGSIQVVRYKRYASPAQKSQSRWIVVALLLNPLWMLVSILSDSVAAATGTDWFSLVELHLQLVLPMLLPLAIMHALIKLGYWGAVPASRQPAAYVRVGITVFALLAIFGTAIQINALASAPDPTQPWELPAGSLPARVLVDTDLGNDDVLALLFLMQHPGIELQAVTVVGTGLVHCEPGIQNVHGLLELADYADIPVSCGIEQPLGAEHAFPDAWRSAADRLWGLGLPHNDRQPAAQPAPELLAETLANADQPLSVLALGPLTNLAQAFQANPEVISKIERLYMMGGAVDVPGNVYDPNLGFENQTAEWNFYADTVAARIVFESGVPITLIPLDATNYVPVRMPLFNLLQQHHATRAATFTFDIFYINQGWIQSGQYYLWDTLASTVLTNPEVASYQDYDLQVVTDPGPDYGRTQVSTEGRPVQVATQPDSTLFEEIFLRVLNTEHD